jgi:hypothetical protein
MAAEVGDGRSTADLDDSTVVQEYCEPAAEVGAAGEPPPRRHLQPVRYPPPSAC